MVAQRPSALPAVIQALVAVAYLSVTAIVLVSEDPSLARFPAILAGGALAALIFRQGWIIPCTLLGPIVAVLTMPAIRGGSAESQIEEDVGRIIFCTSFGLAIGLLLDLHQQFAQLEPATAQSSARDTVNGPDQPER